MAKASKEKKKPKMKTIRFYGFNIKLQSNDRSGEDVYYQLIKSIFDRDIQKLVFPEKAMTFKTQFENEWQYKGTKHKVLHGQMVRFGVLDENHWYNTKTREYVKHTTPENTFPNGYETDYIFIPAAHRFYFGISQKVTIKAAFMFLSKALAEVINQGENIRVNLIQSTDTFEEIINSAGIKHLNVTISYTNDDIGEDAKKLMDELLKEGQIDEAEMNFKPDKAGKLNAESSLIRGSLELAKENGEAIATIIKADGKRTKIVTNNYPEKRAVTFGETDDVNNVLFKDIMKEYRDGENDE